jgi:hypothetical protein
VRPRRQGLALLCGPSTSPLGATLEAGELLITVLGLLAVGGSFYAAWNAWYAYVSRSWPSAPGRLISGGLYVAPGIPQGYGTRVHYSYSVEGTPYECRRLRFGSANPFSELLTRSDLMSAVSRSPLLVYYDPRSPSRACLLPGPNEGSLAIPILLGLLGAGMLMLVVIAHGGA